MWLIINVLIYSPPPTIWPSELRVLMIQLFVQHDPSPNSQMMEANCPASSAQQPQKETKLKPPARSRRK